MREQEEEKDKEKDTEITQNIQQELDKGGVTANANGGVLHNFTWNIYIWSELNVSPRACIT